MRRPSNLGRDGQRGYFSGIAAVPGADDDGLHVMWLMHLESCHAPAPPKQKPTDHEKAEPWMDI
jgi:hypothetical protein